MPFNIILESEFLTRVKALVFTDSFYHSMCHEMNLREEKWANKVGIHYKKFNKIQLPIGKEF